MVKPHLIKTFKISNDKKCAEKLVDVVGLYLSPPENALVLSYDAKSQIQALDRTQKSLPMLPGCKKTLTHDYKRNGTTMLFAAIELLAGRIIAECMPRHRHQEWINFLKKIDAETLKHLDLHLIVDNFATHKHSIPRPAKPAHRVTPKRPPETPANHATHSSGPWPVLTRTMTTGQQQELHHRPQGTRQIRFDGVYVVNADRRLWLWWGQPWFFRTRAPD